jgi:ribose 5-phosphate isomerase A
MSQEKAKKTAAKAALSMVHSNMIVGLGSGSTAEFFISYLIEKVKQGLQIIAVCSSKKSEFLAQKGNILVKNINDVNLIDITIDGADEIDTKKRMIKGGGAAHVREKILAYASKKMVAIVDSSKIVKKLGGKKLPVEVLPFGHKHVQTTLKRYSFESSFRKNEENSILITDNHNYILDVDISKSNKTLENIHADIRLIPGVVDTGLFFNIAKKVIIGFEDGRVEILD